MVEIDPNSVESVRSLGKYTENFLCEIKDNLFKIKFLNFRVRDLDSGFVLFEVSDDGNPNEEEVIEDNNSRLIRYHLGPDFLDLKNIGTLLKFSVGPLPVKNLLMIEKHFFKEKLIKAFEFKFDFCMPNSVNEWETLYEIPELDLEVKDEMIECPWETKSDTFYFADGRLIMHHKAIYNYSPFE